MTSKVCRPPPPNTAEEGKQGTQPHGATVSSGCDPGEQGKGAQASPQDAWQVSVSQTGVVLGTCPHTIIASQATYGTNCPVWEEAFRFFLQDPRSQELDVQVRATSFFLSPQTLLVHFVPYVVCVCKILGINSGPRLF